MNPHRRKGKGPEGKKPLPMKGQNYYASKVERILCPPPNTYSHALLRKWQPHSTIAGAVTAQSGRHRTGQSLSVIIEQGWSLYGAA